MIGKKGHKIKWGINVESIIRNTKQTRDFFFPKDCDQKMEEFEQMRKDKNRGRKK